MQTKRLINLHDDEKVINYTEKYRKQVKEKTN